MRPVKWDQVKLKACQEASLPETRTASYALLAGVEDGTFDWRGNSKQLQEAVWERIAHWDIRCIRKLHELFPRCLPKNCKYIAVLRDDGHWWIED
jgi:hypothetical protein